MTQRYIRIELAPADMRRLEVETNIHKGYVSPAHLADMAADILGNALRGLEESRYTTDEDNDEDNK